MQFLRVIVYFFVLIASLVGIKDDIKENGVKGCAPTLYALLFFVFLFLLGFLINAVIGNADNNGFAYTLHNAGATDYNFVQEGDDVKLVVKNLV